MDILDDPDWKLLEAVEREDEMLVTQLLQQGANPNIRDVISRASSIHIAAIKGNLAISDKLIAAGADISAGGTDTDSTPLGTALICGHLNLAHFLLAKGAKLSATEITTGLLDEARGLGYGSIADVIEEDSA